jgi:hypothetical protein
MGNGNLMLSQAFGFNGSRKFGMGFRWNRACILRSAPGPYHGKQQ